MNVCWPNLSDVEMTLNKKLIPYEIIQEYSKLITQRITYRFAWNFGDDCWKYVSLIPSSQNSKLSTQFLYNGLDISMTLIFSVFFGGKINLMNELWCLDIFSDKYTTWTCLHEEISSGNALVTKIYWRASEAPNRVVSCMTDREKKVITDVGFTFLNFTLVQEIIVI